jgi:hypothetical protein
VDPFSFTLVGEAFVVFFGLIGSDGYKRILTNGTGHYALHIVVTIE